uniref:Uncharacterized protein n=2 Tax=Aegilops tauschii subsp. strangulata TaxID=200361 RepID=A0A453R960_AEGTS
RSSSHQPRRSSPSPWTSLSSRCSFPAQKPKGVAGRQGAQPQPANPSCPHAAAGSFSRPAGSRHPHPWRRRRRRRPRVHSAGEVRLFS